MREVEVFHTHLYPGARARLRAPGEGAAVTVIFADGTRVAGRLEDDRLTVEPHSTAAGTPIGRKTWPVARDGDRLRITGRPAG